MEYHGIMLVVRCCMPALLMVRLPNIPHCTGNKCTFAVSYTHLTLPTSDLV